ncbi:plasmid mobilization protein [Mucilaginibacter segetis]|uniref:Plasmid mobilization relaxosome protein MobC n=1 Tax=Mucilaginibacter segetis TaxID=2793071 RepID=A0A934PT78_9SPHI|nr:plasmid mobilization relaxosome protein MobC [Mucilaginibacter segetis]MBK0378553.1 plasmid mobilization relaxosome protein MobC [Mucilaginibacter segetis]
MEKQKENRSKTLLTRLKPDEYQSIYSAFKKTRFNKLSEYSRSLLLSKPVVVNYRDKSMDEMLEELALLRRELNAIGTNLNQAVRQINSAQGNAEKKLWLNLLSVIGTKIDPAIGQIKDRMQNFSELWSQKLKREEASSAR